MNFFKIRNRRRDYAGERIGPKDERLQIREKEERIRNRTGELIVGEIDGDQLSELRNERRESSGITGGIKGELSDAVAGAR